MLKLPDVALVMVDNIAPELASQSLYRSCSQVQFGSVHVYTNKPDDYGPLIPNQREIHLRYFDGTDLNDVAAVLWEKLPEHVVSKYVLIQQWDSWVLDPTAWRDDFFKHDYIGAPWPWHPDRQVGNGGFSLRSMRLIRFVREHGFHKAWHEDGRRVNEDEAVCRVNRHVIDRHFSFAPPALASSFAFERGPYEGPGIHFGFHGLFNFKTVLSQSECVSAMLRVNANEYLRNKPEAIHERMHGLDTEPSNAIA